MAVLETNRKVASLVFMDFESTGIPLYEFQPRATEICLIAVERQHFESLGEEEKELRIQNKLLLCVCPRKRISQNSTHLTGLSNENLQNQKPVNEDFVQTLWAFLKRLPTPVCLVAHNGNKFDFPLLQAELRNVDCTLPEDLLCTDSYCAFRSLLEHLPTQTNFLPAPLNLPTAQPAETVPEVDKLPNTSDEESDWLDEELLMVENYRYESLGFAVEYDDIVSDGENSDTLTLESTTLKITDIAINVEQGSVVLIKNSEVSASKVILLDCDNPNCECSDCTPQNFQHDVKKEQSCIEENVNGGIIPVASVSESGIEKQLNGLGKITITDGQNFNDKSQVRKSVIESVTKTSAAFPFINGKKNSVETIHERSRRKEPEPSNSVPAPKNVRMKMRNLEVDAILEDDMDFVVSYVLSPEFKNMDANIDVEFLKQQADITPLKSIVTPCTLSRHTRKQTMQRGESLEQNQEQQGEVATFDKKQDKVKKRLFAEHELNISVASSDLFNVEESLATVIMSSSNRQVPDAKEQEAICRSPPKCISNGEILKSNGRISAASFDEMSNQKIADVTCHKSPANPLASLTKCSSPPKRRCNGIGLINNISDLTCSKEMEDKHHQNMASLTKEPTNVSQSAATSLNETASITPSFQPHNNLAVRSSMCISQPTQKNTQQRAKLKYGLEALHELLVGTKPLVSHTAEDDTEALMRVCRTKRRVFCEWVDNHAVRLNLIPPMWVKKK